MNRTKYYLFFTTLFAALFFFVAGRDAYWHHYFAAVVDAGLALFLVGLTYMTMYDDLRSQLSKELSKKAQKDLNKIFQEGREYVEKMMHPVSDEERHDERLMGEMMDIVNELAPDGLPAAKQLKTIEDRFHAQTDHFAKLTLINGRVDVEISAEPFKAATKAKISQAASKGVKVPVRRMQTKAEARKSAAKNTQKKVK